MAAKKKGGSAETPRTSAYAKSAEDDTLDLSLQALSEVSAGDIALLPKITRIDLSSNALVHLPDAFCSLARIVHLDLKNNRLTSLPALFGNLSALKHLDLSRTKLECVRLCLCPTRINTLIQIAACFFRRAQGVIVVGFIAQHVR